MFDVDVVVVPRAALPAGLLVLLLLRLLLRLFLGTSLAPSMGLPKLSAPAPPPRRIREGLDDAMC